MIGSPKTCLHSHRKAGTRLSSHKGLAIFRVYWLVPGSFKYLFAGSQLQLFKWLVPSKTCLHSQRNAGTWLFSLKGLATFRVYWLVPGSFKYLFAGSRLTAVSMAGSRQNNIHSHRKAGTRFYSLKNPATFMVYWLVPGSSYFPFLTERVSLYGS